MRVRKISVQRESQAVAISKNFRKKWRRIISDLSVKEPMVVSVVGRNGSDGSERFIYFVSTKSKRIGSFKVQLAKAQKDMKRVIGSAIRPQTAWLPTFVSNCVSLSPTTMIAHSQKPVSVESAKAFANKLGKRLPRNLTSKSFYKISITGKRYVLEARSRDIGHERYPMSKWCVVEVSPEDIDVVFNGANFHRLNMFHPTPHLPNDSNRNLVCKNERTALYWKIDD